MNDAYGHRAGSATLTEVALVITRSVRDSDFVRATAATSLC